MCTQNIWGKRPSTYLDNYLSLGVLCLICHLSFILFVLAPNSFWPPKGSSPLLYVLFCHGGGGNGGACVSKSLYPHCPPRHLHVFPLWKLSAWWTTEFSPVYANPTSLNKEEEGRMVKDTDAGDGVSVKTPGGRQRETTSLLFQRIWL